MNDAHDNAETDRAALAEATGPPANLDAIGARIAEIRRRIDDLETEADADPRLAEIDHAVAKAAKDREEHAGPLYDEPLARLREEDSALRAHAAGLFPEGEKTVTGAWGSLGRRVKRGVDVADPWGLVWDFRARDIDVASLADVKWDGARLLPLVEAKIVPAGMARVVEVVSVAFAAPKKGGSP